MGDTYRNPFTLNTEVRSDVQSFLTSVSTRSTQGNTEHTINRHIISVDMHANPTAVAVMNGTIDRMSLTNGGSGYTSVPTIGISGGGGSGATATAVMGASPGAGTIDNAGSGYSGSTNITVSGGGGSGAAFAVTLSGGSITAITQTSAGTGYTSVPTLTVVDPDARPGRDGAVSCTLSVVSLTITATGSGYTSAPTVAFSGGGGSSAAATATIAFDVASVTVTNIPTASNSLSHTTVPSVTFSGGGGSGAAATAVLSNGFVESLTVTNAGSGYTSAPTVTLGLPSTNTLRVNDTFIVRDKGADVYLDSLTLFNGILADSIDNSGFLVSVTIYGGTDGTLSTLGNIGDKVFMVANINTSASTVSFHSNQKHNYLMHLLPGHYHNIEIQLTNKAKSSIFSSVGSGQRAEVQLLVVDRNTNSSS